MQPILRDPSLFRHQAYFSGGWSDSASGQCLGVFDPADGESLGSVPDLSAGEVAAAIADAAKAMEEWRYLTASRRSSVLHRWHALLIENAGDLAALITAEQGKPLAEAQREVEYGAD